MAARRPTEKRKHNGAAPVHVLHLSQSKARSKVTNGTALLPNVDGRSLWVRRFRDLAALHLADLGGAEFASEAKKALVRRAACLMIELERLEQQFAQNSGSTPAELDSYQRATNTLRRVLVTLGLERRQKEVDDLESYLRKRTTRRIEADEAEIVS